MLIHGPTPEGHGSDAHSHIERRLRRCRSDRLSTSGSALS